MVNHYALRAPQSILHLREDTMSQLLVLANVRPGGRYLLVDDTGGLVTAAMLERMGCEGSIMTFTETDSPPAWGVLSVMNFAERELECVKWLNWMEADEDYKRRASIAQFPAISQSLISPQLHRPGKMTCLPSHSAKPSPGKSGTILKSPSST
jgi:tRNA (adenine-N(1)-)-methyltransferase non-catalytic subunit